MKIIDLVGAKVVATEIFSLGVGGGLLAVSLDFTSLGVLVAAIGTAIATVISARSAAKKAEAESKRLAGKIEEVKTQAEVIKSSVDGAAHQQKSENDVLRAELKILRELLADKTASADKLAQAAATALAAPPAAVAPVIPPAAAEHSLVSIDDNTKAIERNTAKTDATVQEIQHDQKQDP
jgi:seryl-tRNA synthetase